MGRSCGEQNQNTLYNFLNRKNAFYLAGEGARVYMQRPEGNVQLSARSLSSGGSEDRTQVVSVSGKHFFYRLSHLAGPSLFAFHFETGPLSFAQADLELTLQIGQTFNLPTSSPSLPSR